VAIVLELCADDGERVREQNEVERLLMDQIPQSVAWLVSFVLVEAAVIDGRTLRVPNWLTYHFAIAGLVFAFWKGGTPLLAWSFAGAGVGLLSLLPLYAIGGMGAGDVKLMAGMGAWIGPWFTLWAFMSTALVGGLMGLAMMAYSGNLLGHFVMMQTIGREIMAIRNPTELSARAAERKPRMLLLPYGIPIAVGSIIYFVWLGLLF
jgi:prepilin peptidase CpaA